MPRHGICLGTEHFSIIIQATWKQVSAGVALPGNTPVREVMPLVNVLYPVAPNRRQTQTHFRAITIPECWKEKIL